MTRNSSPIIYPGCYREGVGPNITVDVLRLTSAVFFLSTPGAPGTLDVNVFHVGVCLIFIGCWAKALR